MWTKNIFIFLFVSIVLTTDLTFAQQPSAKKDSTRIYKNIESYSKRSNFAKSIYQLIFKPLTTKSTKKKGDRKVYKKLIKKPYSAFEGKIIRFIHIETLDPFGYSINDTNVINQNFLLKTGNNLHVKTKNIAIRNLLLIRQNQTFDSLLVKESERLVRSRVFVQDVSFFVKTTAIKSDSVDIFIRESDNWSIIPNFTVSASSISITLTDKNFAGLGHEFQNGFKWYHSPSGYDYNIRYFIPNIRNSYINSTLYYSIDQFKNTSRSFAIDRPFFSPFANWAAGVYFAQQYGHDSIRTDNSIFIQQQFKFNIQDYWAGNAIQIFKDNSENSRTTKFISTVRYLRIRYLEKPIQIPGLPHIHANENFYLASIGISTRKYVMDKYIFKYGVIEDVPIGKIFSLTGGYQEQNNIDRFYLGARISFGNYYSWGYLSSNFEYGTFIRASHAQQTVFTASINYFTGLMEIGNWKFRQFVKPQFTLGINRFVNESLTLNDGYGLDGFNSPELYGSSRMLFSLQTQSYAPWNFIGFRFGPFIICSFGMLGSATSGFKKSKVYSQIGLGVLLKNEHLIINTFQISIAFYPTIPGMGNNVFKMNSFQTADFGFKDFAIGKPAVVTFQ
jgi:hypothetical protein